MTQNPPHKTVRKNAIAHHAMARATLANRRGQEAGQWAYFVAMVLGLLAIAFFAWVLFRSRTTSGGIFDQLNRIFGIGAFCFDIVRRKLDE